MTRQIRTLSEGILTQQLRGVLGTVPNTEFADAARDVLEVLGYQSNRTLPMQTGAVDDFIEAFPAVKPDTKSEESSGVSAQAYDSSSR